MASIKPVGPVLPPVVSKFINQVERKSGNIISQSGNETRISLAKGIHQQIKVNRRSAAPIKYSTDKMKFSVNNAKKNLGVQVDLSL